MTGRNFTTNEIAQRENTAAAGIALAVLQELRATCIGCGFDEHHAHAWLRLDPKRGVGVCSDCDPYREAWDAAHAFGPPHLDLVAHLHRQRAFSLTTFGPGARTAGVVAHIRKELAEIEANPGDLMEWIDVAMLALDGAWRAGHEPAAIALALATKLTRNELRTWPDWRTVAPDTAIEHVRTGPAKGASITITAKALREAIEFCNPDGPEDEDQMKTELTIWMREADEVSGEGEPMPRGLYCHLSEYPEEGCIPLFEVTA